MLLGAHRDSLGRDSMGRAGIITAAAMEAAFKIKLGRGVEAKMATIGRFDGVHPSLAFASGTTGQVLVYAPHETTGAEPGLRVFTFNKTITALGAGPLKKSLRPIKAPLLTIPGVSTVDDLESDVVRDVLLVGLGNAVLAYDVELNSDVFFKDVQDGVNCLTFGRMMTDDGVLPLVIVGGNCSVIGFDAEGGEAFWTVTGDNVSAIGMNGSQLLVGSDDHEIKVFERQEIVSEVTEADKIVELSGLGEAGKYAFGLANGTVGVYHGKRRVWRVKSKQQLVSLTTSALLSTNEVVSAWSNGSVTVRSEDNGSLLFRDVFKSLGVACVLSADLRNKTPNDSQIVAVALNGEVRGYVALEEELATAAKGASAAIKVESEAKCDNLQSEKRALLMELRHLEESARRAAEEEDPESATASSGAVPQDTAVSVELRCSQEEDEHGSANGGSSGGYDLRFSVNNGALIFSVVLTDVDGGLFENESISAMPAVPKAECSVALSPRKNVAARLKLQVHVAARASSTVLHVFELEHQLPKFCTFLRVVEPRQRPTGFVQFKLGAKLEDVVRWAEQSFVNMGPVATSQGTLQLHYRALNHSPLWVEARQLNPEVVAVKISSDFIATAAEIVQDMAQCMEIAQLESLADFPKEMADLAEILEKVSTYNALRMRLTADMADGTHRVKTLVVKAEDARLMSDMPLMRRHYMDLFNLNNELIAEHTKRATNHDALLAALKEVNQIIQRASNLRVGAAQSRVVADSRLAIKSNNVTALATILSEGKATQTLAQ